MSVAIFLQREKLFHKFFGVFFDVYSIIVIMYGLYCSSAFVAKVTYTYTLGGSNLFQGFLQVQQNISTGILRGLLLCYT